MQRLYRLIFRPSWARIGFTPAVLAERELKKLVRLVREITKQLGILERGKRREAQVNPCTGVTHPCCS